MASLLENLMEVLDKENKEYEALIVLADKKTPTIVAGDIESLEKITDDEQEIVGRIQNLEKFRKEVLADVANVVNRDVNELKLINLIQMLDKRPEQQTQLVELQERIRNTVDRLQKANDKNQMLLNDALEMVGFNLSMIQALKTAPQTANYTRRAFSSGSALGIKTGGFDARQ